MLTFVKKRHWGERVGGGGEGAETGRELLLRQKCFCVTVGRKCKGKQWPRLMQQNKGDTEERKEKNSGKSCMTFFAWFSKEHTSHAFAAMTSINCRWSLNEVWMLRSSSSCFWRRIMARSVCVYVYMCVWLHMCVRERVREMFMVCVWERCLWCVCERERIFA